MTLKTKVLNNLKKYTLLNDNIKIAHQNSKKYYLIIFQ